MHWIKNKWLRTALDRLLDRLGYCPKATAVEPLTINQEEMAEAWENIRLRLAVRAFLTEPQEQPFIRYYLPVLSSDKIYRFGLN